MNKYRILEKEGIVRKWTNKNLLRNHHFTNTGGHTSACGDYVGCACNDKGEDYIPKYIVQEIEYNCNKLENNRGWGAFNFSNMPGCGTFKDLKEFKSLAQAYKYKRSLELKDGIVIE